MEMLAKLIYQQKSSKPILTRLLINYLVIFQHIEYCYLLTTYCIIDLDPSESWFYMTLIDIHATYISRFLRLLQSFWEMYSIKLFSSCLEMVTSI